MRGKQTDECDQSHLVVDELLESGPFIHFQNTRGHRRDEDEIFDAAVFESRVEFLNIDIAPVREQQGDNFHGVAVHPALQHGQPGLERSCVLSQA